MSNFWILEECYAKEMVNPDNYCPYLFTDYGGFNFADGCTR